MTEPKTKPVFVRKDGAIQPILRLNKSEMASKRWNSEFVKRLHEWQITKPYHRMGTSNEIHKGTASKCSFCLKRGEKAKVKTEAKSKEVKKPVKRTKGKQKPKSK